MKLPKKPSELLKLAINDMRELDRSIYDPFSFSWHVPIYDDDYQFKHCRVCLAGAVLAYSLQVDCQENAGSYSNGGENFHQLQALENLRQGKIGQALDFLGMNHTKYELPDRVDVKHSMFSSWEQADFFLVEMDHLVDLLENAGA